MIEGLKIRVTSAELQKHFTDRAAYHRERADEKEKALPDLQAAKATLEKLANTNPESLARMTKFGNSSGYHSDPDNAIDALETDIRNHRNKALAFDFFAIHLHSEDYNLSERDLIRLEILK